MIHKNSWKVRHFDTFGGSSILILLNGPCIERDSSQRVGLQSLAIIVALWRPLRHGIPPSLGKLVAQVLPVSVADLVLFTPGCICGLDFGTIRALGRSLHFVLLPLLSDLLLSL